MSLKKAMQAAAKTYKKKAPAKKKAAAKKTAKKTINPAKVEFTSKITIEVGTIVYVKSRNIDVLEMSFKEGKTPTDGTVIKKFRATKIDKDGTVHFKGVRGEGRFSPTPAILKHFLEIGLGIKNGHSRVSASALGTKVNPYKSIRRNGKTITGRTRAKKYLRRTGALGVYYQNKSGDIHRLSWTPQ